MDIKYPTQKGQSDFALACDWVKDNVCESFEIQLYGAIGGRADHQLAIYGEIDKLLSECSHCLKLESFKIDKSLHFMASANTQQLNHKASFSLFCLRPTNVSISGNIFYPLENHHLSALSSLGLSNEASGDFEVEASSTYFIFFNKA